LGDLIELRSLDASSDDATISLSLQYVVRRTGETQDVLITREGVGP
jgi:hypothetical protein